MPHYNNSEFLSVLNQVTQRFKLEFTSLLKMFEAFNEAMRKNDNDQRNWKNSNSKFLQWHLLKLENVHAFNFKNWYSAQMENG